MMDRLPFPHITAMEYEERVDQLIDYLMQLKETLEFELTGISTDNLSKELRDKLNNMEEGIESSNNVSDDKIQQVQNNALTLYDIINSELFKMAMQDNRPTLKINFENGNLEYE